MNNKLKTIIVGRNSETARSLESALSHSTMLAVSCHISSNGNADLLKGLPALPEILIVDLSHLWQEELAALSNLPAEQRPQIIVVDSQVNPEVMRASMKIGARDYFAHPLDVNSLKESIVAISKEANRPGESKHVNLITVINGKGGSGSTMIASNLSYILANKYMQKVALYDFHTDVTSLPLYFDLDIERNLVDTLRDIEQLDEIALQGSMTKYGDNLNILTSKRDFFGPGVHINSYATKKLIKLGSRKFDFIVVDMPMSHADDLSILLSRSDHVFIVTQQSIPHLSETSLVHNYIDNQSTPKNKISVVVNRYKASDAIRLDEFKDVICENIYTVPSDYKTVNYSLNVGKPLYECAKHSAVTNSIADIAKSLLGVEEKGVIQKITKPFSNIFRSGNQTH